jgi:hypothetical protein
VSRTLIIRYTRLLSPLDLGALPGAAPEAAPLYCLRYSGTSYRHHPIGRTAPYCHVLYVLALLPPEYQPANLPYFSPIALKAIYEK